MCMHCHCHASLYHVLSGTLGGRLNNRYVVWGLIFSLSLEPMLKLEDTDKPDYTITRGLEIAPAVGAEARCKLSSGRVL